MAVGKATRCRVNPPEAVFAKKAGFAARLLPGTGTLPVPDIVDADAPGQRFPAMIAASSGLRMRRRSSSTRLKRLPSFGVLR